MPRFFTLEQANALLPQLRVLLPEAQSCKRRLEQQQRALAASYVRLRSNGHNPKELGEAQAAAQQSAAELEQAVCAVTDLGCEIKDLDVGLVDFPARRGGRTLYLCWRLDEDTIRFWHELDTGFAGRRPLEGLPGP